MHWKELRKFLNSKFHDEDEIILAVDYNSGLPIIIKSNYLTNINNSFTNKLLYADSSTNTCTSTSFTINETNTPSNLSDNDTNSSFQHNESNEPIEFSFNEISTFFK